MRTAIQTSVPVNKLAALQVNQKGCDDSVNELLIRRQQLSEKTLKLHAELANRGLPAGRRATLKTIQGKLNRELMAISKVLDRRGIGKLERKALPKTKADAFVMAAKQMLNDELFMSIVKNADELLNRGMY